MLVRISELFGVTVNDLISETKVEQLQAGKEGGKYHSHCRTVLRAGLVCGDAFVFLLKVCLPESEWLWMTFVYAVYPALWRWSLPICGGDFGLRAYRSALVWGVTICIHITALVPNVQNMALIYAAAGVFQVLVILWYLYLLTKRRAKKEEDRGEREEAPSEACPGETDRSPQ